MRIRLPRRSHNSTAYVALDTGKCRACWDCLGACPEGVIGKIDLFFHKHSLLVHPENCRGCLRCVEICPEGAITRLKRGI